jgi:hypothetical protein
MSALTIAAVIGGAVGWRLRHVASGRMLVAGGSVLAWVGLLAFSGIDPDTSSPALWAGVLWTGGWLGLAAGAAYADPIEDLIQAAAPGAAAILAVTGAVFQAQQAHERGLGDSFQGALSSGVGDALGTLAVVVLVCAIACVTRAWSAARPAAES